VARRHVSVPLLGCRPVPVRPLSLPSEMSPEGRARPDRRHRCTLRTGSPARGGRLHRLRARHARAPLRRARAAPNPRRTFWPTSSVALRPCSSPRPLVRWLAALGALVGAVLDLRMIFENYGHLSPDPSDDQPTPFASTRRPPPRRPRPGVGEAACCTTGAHCGTGRTSRSWSGFSPSSTCHEGKPSRARIRSW
jgi:hypothetical protein